MMSDFANQIKRAQAVQAEYIRQLEEAKKGPKESHKAVNAVVSSAEDSAGVGPKKDEPDVATQLYCLTDEKWFFLAYLESSIVCDVLSSVFTP